MSCGATVGSDKEGTDLGALIRRGALVTTFLCLVFAALSSSAFASKHAPAAPAFHPRVGNAMGLIPPVPDQGTRNFEPNEAGIFTAVTYHGGVTMTGGVTVHTIFWAPAGFAFQGSPGAGIPTYKGMV